MESKLKILIVEDDTTLAAGLCRALDSQGEFESESCESIKTARGKMARQEYALIILDVNLPDGNGFDFLPEIKQKYDIPVIMLTANDLETDIVSGLEAGADDYITKPFSLAVLRARVNTQLRKRMREETRLPTITIDSYIFDFEKMQFSNAGNLIELSKTEQKLLWCLINNRDTTLSRNFLMNYIWTASEYVDENALSVTVKRLRDKLSAQKYIRTIYGVGYVWQKL